MQRLLKRLFFWTFMLATVLRTAAARADAPTVIRVGYPGVGVGNRPAVSGNVVATLHLKGLLEQEFKKDGIKIEWSFLRGAGPAVNELFANGLLDFSHLGDLPSVVGRASGLKYRVLASSGVRGNIYLSTPADSNIHGVAELRGRKVAVQKGTATHLAALKILERFGLAEKDVRLINMDANTAKAAIVTKDIDAAFGGSDWLGLRDQGVSRLVYTTKGQDPKLTSNGLFLGSEDFIRKYPEITQRVVNTLVVAAKWIADSQEDPTPLFHLWQKSGFTFASFKEDWKGDDLKYKTSPLLDPYVASRYDFQIQEAKRLNLLRNSFSFAEWTEPKFLNQALKDQSLEAFWSPRGLDGNPTTAGRQANAK
jgi:sulfonate transport system substrate-binding protein